MFFYSTQELRNLAAQGAKTLLPEQVDAVKTFGWASNVGEKPHPDLCSLSPTCRLVPFAIRDNALYIGVCELCTNMEDPLKDVQAIAQDVANQLTGFAPAFLRLDPTQEGKLAKLAILLWPELDAAHMTTLAGVKQSLWLSYVCSGLLLEEYPDPNGPPFFGLMVRYLLPEDWELTLPYIKDAERRRIAEDAWIQLHGERR